MARTAPAVPSPEAPGRLRSVPAAAALLTALGALAGLGCGGLLPSGGPPPPAGPRFAPPPERPPIAAPTVVRADESVPAVDGTAAPVVEWAEPADPLPVETVATLEFEAEYAMTRIEALAWSPDGSRLAVGGEVQDSGKELFRCPTRIYLREGTTFAPVGEAASGLIHGSGANTNVADLAWSPDGGTLALAGAQNFATSLFDPDGTLRADLETPADAVFALAWRPAGDLLAVATAGPNLRAYAADGRALQTVGPAGPTLAFSPSGDRLVSTAPGGAVLWTVPAAGGAGEAGPLTATARLELPTLPREIWPHGVGWSPGGGTLAVSQFGDGTVWLFDADGAPKSRLQGHEGSVWFTHYSADGVLATGGSDVTVRLWNPDGSPRATLRSGGQEDRQPMIDLAAWSPDGSLLAVVSPNRTIRLWNADGEPRATLSGHVGIISALAWSPDGRLLATADDDATTRVWAVPAAR
ncbi:WD40 repeat domain-containing protein [Alienimonas californiensis]|uniref:Translocation protein TolB n=1 Tax=Alienimonas californiensis TaxID=2527989 RepID=A0A517PBD1_9PLAN|nr:hypothetical protein [Alienimonas californiensis]QDT16694.1 translocation protein TolB [Alienimonas californiensis]